MKINTFELFGIQNLGVKVFSYTEHKELAKDLYKYNSALWNSQRTLALSVYTYYWEIPNNDLSCVRLHSAPRPHSMWSRVKPM